MNIKTLYKKNKKPKEPSIHMNYSVLKKLIVYTQSVKTEITLLGVVDTIKNKYYITDFLVPPQTENSGVYTTTHDEKYPEWLSKIPRETRLKMRCHLHTHPKMSPIPSGTDIQTILEKIEDIDDFYIRIIMNSNKSTYIDFFDIKNNLLYEKIHITVHIKNQINLILDMDGLKVDAISIPKASKQKWEKEVTDKIIIKKYAYNYRPQKKLKELTKREQKEFDKEIEMRNLYGYY